MFGVFLSVQILSAEQIKKWDSFTIEHEPITSIELMERAAKALFHWIHSRYVSPAAFSIFCGKGNNGGDGLALARILMQAGYSVSVYILEFGKKGSPDFQQNLQRLHKNVSDSIHYIQEPTHFPALPKDEIVIDALFGIGLNKPIQGLSAQLIHYLNSSGKQILSIDLPSGLFADQESKGNSVITATYTLTFQSYKTALLFSDNAVYTGSVQVLDIGLHPDFLTQIEPCRQLLDENIIRQLFKPRNQFGHKGTYGHALIAGGSFGKIGALVLSLRACLATGAGLTSAFTPGCGYTVVQTSVPEAMTIADSTEKHLSSPPDDIEKYNAIGIGPGMGTAEETQKVLSFFVKRCRKPLVIDADGLNILAKNPSLLNQLPANTILTPHPKEFDRLFGEHQSDFARMNTATQKAKELIILIVLKGHHTLIATPEGCVFFNSTGNAGMAKGGSGDVLTGMLTALLAQGYAPAMAAKLGVYLHGWAGDVAAKKYSQESMLPSHLIECLPKVFLALST